MRFSNHLRDCSECISVRNWTGSRAIKKKQFCSPPHLISLILSCCWHKLKVNWLRWAASNPASPATAAAVWMLNCSFLGNRAKLVLLIASSKGQLYLPIYPEKKGRTINVLWIFALEVNPERGNHWYQWAIAMVTHGYDINKRRRTRTKRQGKQHWQRLLQQRLQPK